MRAQVAFREAAYVHGRDRGLREVLLDAGLGCRSERRWRGSWLSAEAWVRRDDLRDVRRVLPMGRLAGSDLSVACPSV